MAKKQSIAKVRINEKKQSSRILYLDILRIIACFLVIVNHTMPPVFLEASKASTTWWIGVPFFFVCKVAVPIFLMVSGVVLLGREVSIRKHLKRIWRMVIVLTVISFLYAFFLHYSREGISTNLYAQFDSISLENLWKFIVAFVHGPISNALWYMYMYIGILAFLPILNRLISAMKKADYYWLFMLGAISSGLMVLRAIHPQLYIGGGLLLAIPATAVTLFVLGYYIHNFVKTSKWLDWTALGVLMMVVAIQTAVAFVDNGPDGTWKFASYDYLPTVINSACVFYLVKSYVERRKVSPGARLGKVLTYIGATTFGIYLISDYIIGTLHPFDIQMRTVLPPLLSVTITEVLSFVCGFVITVAVRKIPKVNKYL
jgi:surface polysaccharide O-acyltransferase-like enzyme